MIYQTYVYIKLYDYIIEKMFIIKIAVTLIEKCHCPNDLYLSKSFVSVENIVHYVTVAPVQ